MKHIRNCLGGKREEVIIMYFVTLSYKPVEDLPLDERDLLLECINI